MNAVGPCVAPDGVGPTRVVVRTSTRNRVEAMAQPDGSALALGTAYHVTVRQAVVSAWAGWLEPRTRTTARAAPATSVATMRRIAVRRTARRKGGSWSAGWWSLCVILLTNNGCRYGSCAHWGPTGRSSSRTRPIHGQAARFATWSALHSRVQVRKPGGFLTPVRDHRVAGLANPRHGALGPGVLRALHFL